MVCGAPDYPKLMPDPVQRLPTGHCRNRRKSRGQSPPRGSRPRQPHRRIGAVVGLFRRLDVVEKVSINHGVPRGSDRGKQDRSAGGVRTGNGFTPLLQPVRPHGVDGGVRDPVKKSRLAEQWMAHAAVAPVEQRQSPLIAAKIARMEVAVHQRVANAASGAGISSLTRATTLAIAAPSGRARQSGSPEAAPPHGRPMPIEGR
jgi:hypothetical protein